ncbi:hypothetical protein [Nitrospira calida]|jgi:hypothetical protein
MTAQDSHMSPVKLALLVLWPAFWTGLPIKLVVALLMLASGAMQLEAGAGLAFLLLLASPVTAVGLPIVSVGFDLPLGEGPGLAFLFLLAIPVDIWALGLSGRTVFLDKLRVEPPEGLGLTLWWKIALVSAIYFPLLCLVESTVYSAARSVAHAIMEADWLKTLPVAERIALELNLWGVPVTLVLLGLIVGWLWSIGRIVQPHVKAARPASEPYQSLVRRWDVIRIPSDQPLLLTVFAGTGAVLVLLFWAFLPATTPRPHESYKRPEVKIEPPFKPAEALQKAEKLLAQAEATVQALEHKSEHEAKEKGKGKEKAGGKDKAAVKADNGSVSESASTAPAASQPEKP